MFEIIIFPFVLKPFIELVEVFFRNLGPLFETLGETLRFVVEDIYMEFFGEIIEFALFESWQEQPFQKLGAIILTFLIVAAHLFILRLLLRLFSG